MSVVRMQIDEAEALVTQYDLAERNVSNVLTDLSPLIAEARSLLEQPAQSPIYGPVPALQTTINDLRSDSEDLAWRIALIVEHDNTQLDLLELATLNEQIANWPGTDNDPLFDALVRERQGLIEEQLTNGESIDPAMLMALLPSLHTDQVVEAEAANPGTFDLALLNAIIATHDKTAFPDDPLDPDIESARQLRDSFVIEIAGDKTGQPDVTIAAIAQQNGITYAEAQTALDIAEIDRLNDQSRNVPSIEATQMIREHRDTYVLELADGHTEFAAMVAGYLNRGSNLNEAWTLAAADVDDIIAAYNGQGETAMPEVDRGFFGGLKHNLFDGGSVVGDIITGDHTAVANALWRNSDEITETLGNAGTAFNQLNPSNMAGMQLLLTDPEQFAENWSSVGGGSWDWAVDTGKLVAATSIVSNPITNAAFERQTSRNLQEEVGEAIINIANVAAQDPDALALGVIDWEGLQEDPHQWLGGQAPDVIIEILTGGAFGTAVSTRRAGNIAIDLTDAVSDASEVARHFDELTNLNLLTGTTLRPLPDNVAARLENVNVDEIDFNLERTLKQHGDSFDPSDHFQEPAPGVYYDRDGAPIAVDREIVFEHTNMANNPILTDQVVQQEMAQAWMDSTDLYTFKENGGWLIQNADGSHEIMRWPEGLADEIGIPTDSPGNAVGAFHTHPNSKGLQRPSPKDIEVVIQRPELAPHYIVSHDGIWVIDSNGTYMELG